MNHDAFAEKLLDLAYGELSPREAGKVEAHAATCEACRAELARIRETRSLMARLPAEPAPEKGERILFAAARQAAEERASRRRVPPWLWRSSLVAASLVLVVAVSYRIVAMRVAPFASKPSDEALLGGPYATPPPAAAPEAHAAAELDEKRDARADRDEVGALGGLRRPPPAEEKKAGAPARAERPSRAFAEAPPPRSAAARPEPPPAEAARSAPPRPPAAAEAAQPAPAPAPARREAKQQDLQATVAAPPSAQAGAAPETASRLELQEPRDRELSAKAAKPSAARKTAAPDALAYGGSRAAADAVQRVQSRTFDRCEGESSRRVELDAEGRVVRYVREGRFGGRRVRVVHTYRRDGALASATAQDLDAGGAAVDPRALGIEITERAEDAGIDAPRRCGP
jgi:Putative zinc-finger